MSIRKIVPLTFILLALTAIVAFACSVPVFRYALERWDASEYTLIYYYKSPLSDADKATLDQIEKKIDAAKTAGCNITLTKIDLTLDVTDQGDKDLNALYASQKNAELPYSILLFPKKITFGTVLANPNEPPPPTFEPCWSGKLTPEFLDKILDSPARTDVATKIQKGETAVWILLESGDKAKDDAAAKALQTGLDTATKDLKLPDIDPNDPSWAGGTPLADIKAKLKISFAVKRISRTDAAEAFFINSLLQSESGLNDPKYAKEPIVFAVFGQGRLYKALVGKGITADEVVNDSAFLVGECSCTIKDQNPGRDLLIKTNWLEAIGLGGVQTIPLPPLQGLPDNPPPKPALNTPQTTQPAGTK